MQPVTTVWLDSPARHGRSCFWCSE